MVVRVRCTDLCQLDLLLVLVQPGGLPQQHCPNPRRVADRGENRRSPESTECLARVRSEETVLGVSHALEGITGHTSMALAGSPSLDRMFVSIYVGSARSVRALCVSTHCCRSLVIASFTFVIICHFLSSGVCPQMVACSPLELNI